MSQLNIVKANDVEPKNIRGLPKEAGQIKRIIASDSFFFNVDEIAPGYSPHHWHKHDQYTHEGVKVEYPSNFEEILLHNLIIDESHHRLRPGRKRSRASDAQSLKIVVEFFLEPPQGFGTTFLLGVTREPIVEQ